MFEGFLLECFTCDSSQKHFLKLGPKNTRNSHLKGPYIPMKHDSGQGYIIQYIHYLPTRSPISCAETDEEQVSHNRWTPMKNLTWIIRGMFQIIFMAWSQNHRCVFWAFSLCCSCYQRHSGSIFMWSNNVSVEERPETAKRALGSAGLDHEVWNLILCLLRLCFLNLNHQPHPNYSLIVWWIFRCKDLHCWWPLGWVLEAINPIRSCSWVVALGHLFFALVFFFGGGEHLLVWHCLKDILEGFLSWLWSDSFLYSSGRRFAWLEGSKRNRWSLRYHGVIHPQVSKATTSSFQPMQMKIVSWPSWLE